MISRDYYRKIQIDIIYTKKPLDYRKTMNHENIKPHKKPDMAAQNRFICSICLNKKPLNIIKNDEASKRTAKSCTICQCDVPMDPEAAEIDKPVHHTVCKTKQVQTSQTDIAHGITLLNEVLNVFQNKKKIDTSSARTTILKDVSVNTDAVKLNRKVNLVMSEIFHYAIEDESKGNGEGKFTVLNFEPQCKVENKLSLSKHKSSSIPQMKLEELKHSLKEKTKSKDAIEEVNRMFATVRKFDLDENESNRPLIRSGPRVLPVVKTKNYQRASDENKRQEYQMSSGDSGLQIKSKQNGLLDQCCKSERCAECVYMCCHYQRYKSGVCENCQKFKNLGQTRMERI